MHLCKRRITLLLLATHIYKYVLTNYRIQTCVEPIITWADTDLSIMSAGLNFLKCTEPADYYEQNTDLSIMSTILMPIATDDLLNMPCRHACALSHSFARLLTECTDTDTGTDKHIGTDGMKDRLAKQAGRLPGRAALTKKRTWGQMER